MAQAFKTLPARPNLGYLKKLAKQRLAALRASNGAQTAKLAEAQLIIAREHGFSSWRKLKSHVDRLAVAMPAQVQRFFGAIQKGDIRSIRRMITKHSAIVNAAEPEGSTPLHAAAATNNPEVVAILLDAGARADAQYGRSSHTPLSWAITTRAFKSAEALIANGVKPDLYCAAGLGDLDAVRSFFDADVTLKPDAAQTGSSRYAPDGSVLPCPPPTDREKISDALYIACRQGQTEVARELLRHDPDVNFRAYSGGTPLHWAYFGGSRPIIEMLMHAGADPTLRDHSYRCTPRAFGICVPAAAGWNIIELVRERLAEDPSLVNIQEGRGTPLHEAARGGNAAIALLLLAAGADKTLRDSEGKTPAERAAEAKHDVLALLLKPAGRRPKSNWKPLMDAAFKGDPDRARKLLDAGADPNALGTTGHRYRPLHRAIEHKKTTPKHEGHDHVVALLLERGADPTLRATYDRCTALQLAAMNETRFVPLLRDRFEPLDIFHACVLADDMRVEELLKQDRSLASTRDVNEWQPLHYCAGSVLHKSDDGAAERLARIAQMLIKAGADPMAAWEWNNEWPLRPLYYAAGRANNPAVATVLLDAGADPCDNESVYHAADEGHQECLDLFEQRMDRKKLEKECTKVLNTLLSWGRIRATKWLLEHGADPTWIDPKRGRSAIQEAVKQGCNQKVIAMLKEYADKLPRRKPRK